MDGALGEVFDNALVCQRHIFDRGIVRQHRDDHLSMTGICNAACLVCTQFEERVSLLGAAVEHGDIMSGLHEVRRHRRAHPTQADESSLHLFSSVVVSAEDRCRGAMNSGPTGSVIVSLRMRSILARVAAPSDQPVPPSTASNWSGWRPPQSATLMPWSSIQRTAR